MRRGHPGVGGWRSENPRHFRPRGNGTQRFRSPRIYPLLENPRFPPPNTRLHHRGPQPFLGHTGHPEDHGRQDIHHDRHKYRDGHHQINQRVPERGHHSRQAFPYMHHNIRQTESNQCPQYNNSTNFYEDIQSDSFQVNSMGDVDHRQTPHMTHSHESYIQQHIAQWSNPPPDIKKHYYEHRTPQKSYRHHDSIEASRMPVSDYTGHRPPSSDHYGLTTGPTTNTNNTSFSRSVDDTVDIIRKRLMNRSDPTRLSQDANVQEQENNGEQEVSEASKLHTQQEQPAKKPRTPRQRRNNKSNCDKMKSNIVHQLFKMDKDKMHKLMDDPGSSSKFEYAISSLITESQNSLNRHLRAVAEKSLYTSSTDFIQNDNNTIYEDTFMKQMQCILDPQDTVLLEDIKPIVMAELSKVLQLDDFEQRYDMPDDHNIHPTSDDQSSYQYFPSYSYDEYPQTINYEQTQSSSSNLDELNRIDGTEITSADCAYGHNPTYEETNALFERRQTKRSEHSQDRRFSIERHRRSTEKSAEEVFKSKDEPLPLFDTNTEQFSEDEDTFAELDRQYHVAVDPNFIENDDLSARGTPPKLKSILESPDIKQEIDNQLQTIVKSPLNLFPSSNTDDLREIALQIKREIRHSPNFAKEHTTPTNNGKDTHTMDYVDLKQDFPPKTKETNKEMDKSDNYNTIKISPSNSRKRSIDQRPSHRKEKRKKSESSSSNYDTIKPTLDKKAHTHVNISTKSTEKCNDAPKLYNNVLLNKDESSKESNDNRKSNTVDRSYSDKYVKRKEGSKKSKEKESESGRKRHSSSSSQSILSPKDSGNTSNQTPTKLDPKTKLKTFDMFVEQPKKSSLPHQAHRNTATGVTATKPIVEENKPRHVLTPTQNKIIQIKHVGTQVIKRLITKETQTFQSKSCSTRFCQTDRKKFISKLVQTIPVSLNKSKPKATDAFERMKEIDMEIQVLLQEKFKLYSSLEAKDSCPSSMPTLGMTVLNVSPVDETKEDEIAAPSPENIVTINADEIANDFTNIPVEELEQIALESVQEDSTDSAKIEKRSLRQKLLQQERKSSESPTSSKRNNKKAKSPNISLIEQIITDDRPLEDIISLDDLEVPPAKTRKKPQKSQPKKKVTKRSRPVSRSIDVSSYGIKNCSVVLIPTDVKKFIKEASPVSDDIAAKVTPGASSTDEDSVEPMSVESVPKTVASQEEEVVNDLQFDMLDVSEDIVIGDNCEIKCNDDKDVSEREPVSEDIILDNSQSSADDATSAEGGQTESECKTYDYSTDEKLCRDSVTVTGNADAVLAIECIENDFIAACLDGNVYHFSGDGQLINTLRGSNLAVTCLTIVKEKYGTTVYTGSLDSRIRYYDLESGFEKGPECNVLSPIQTMDRAWDTVFVGTRTGFVLQFECKNNMLIPVSTVKFSEQSILALRAMKEGPRKVLLVAARSEDVTIKDAQTGLLLRTLSGPKMTVYTLLFEDGKVFCGTSSHQIHVFDYASGIHTGCHEGGKGAVCLRATGGLLFAGCYDGCVYVYREGETRPLAQLRGPSLMLLSLAIVGSKIIAGYKDRSLYIWKIPLSILQEMIL